LVEASVYSQLTNLGIPVYPVKIKENSKFPCITYMVVAEVDKTTENKSEIAFKSHRFQVDIFARSYKEAKELKDKAIELLLELGARDISVVDGYEDEEVLFREIIDFTIKE
jgi:hypothetical protein